MSPELEPFLCVLQRLTHLEAPVCPAVPLQVLSQLTGLSELCVDTLPSVAHVAPLTALTKLTVCKLPCADQLDTLTWITHLNLSTDSLLLGELLRGCQDLPLTHLALRTSSPKPFAADDYTAGQWVQHLAPRLQSLDLRAAVEVAQPELEALTGLTALTRLSLDMYAGGDTDPLLTLATPPGLEHLSVSGDRSRLGGAFHIKLSPTVQTLHLRTYWAFVHLYPSLPGPDGALTGWCSETVSPGRGVSRRPSRHASSPLPLAALLAADGGESREPRGLSAGAGAGLPGMAVHGPGVTVGVTAGVGVVVPPPELVPCALLLPPTSLPLQSSALGTAPLATCFVTPHPHVMQPGSHLVHPLLAHLQPGPLSPTIHAAFALPPPLLLPTSGGPSGVSGGTGGVGGSGTGAAHPLPRPGRSPVAPPACLLPLRTHWARLGSTPPVTTNDGGEPHPEGRRSPGDGGDAGSEAGVTWSHLYDGDLGDGDCDVSPHPVSHLAMAGCTLREVMLDACFQPACCLGALGDLVGLPVTRLGLDAAVALRDPELWALTSLTHLTHVSITGVHGATDAGLATLAELPLLCSLKVSGAAGLETSAAQSYARAHRPGTRGMMRVPSPGAQGSEGVEGRFLLTLVACPRLSHLGLRQLHRITEERMTEGLRRLTGLTRLKLQECPGVTDGVLCRAVAPHLTALESLSVLHCQGVTAVGRAAVLAARGLGVGLDFEGCNVRLDGLRLCPSTAADSSVCAHLATCDEE